MLPTCRGSGTAEKIMEHEFLTNFRLENKVSLYNISTELLSFQNIKQSFRTFN